MSIILPLEVTNSNIDTLITLVGRPAHHTPSCMFQCNYSVIASRNIGDAFSNVNIESIQTLSRVS